MADPTQPAGDFSAKVRKLLRLFYDDWAKAPISGTAILVCYAGVVLCALSADLHGMLLFLLVAIATERDRRG